MLTYDQIKAAVLKAIRKAGREIDSKEIHLAIEPVAPITRHRLSGVLARMCKEGDIVSVGPKARLTFRLRTLEDDRITMSDAMKDRAEIYAFKPLVSAPRVAPMREIPAWSRQPL